MNRVTATLIEINRPLPDGRWVDVVEITDNTGEVVDCLWIESSSEREPYDQALAEAGWGDATWTERSL